MLMSEFYIWLEKDSTKKLLLWTILKNKIYFLMAKRMDEHDKPRCCVECEYFLHSIYDCKELADRYGHWCDYDMKSLGNRSPYKLPACGNGIKSVRGLPGADQ